MKNHKIVNNSTITEDIVEISTDLESLEMISIDVCSTLKTIKFYVEKLATNFYWQLTYLLGCTVDVTTYDGLVKDRSYPKIAFTRGGYLGITLWC